MAKFARKSKADTTIPTSALPDIIFILLFFFMVVTKPRNEEVKVENDIPQATQVTKLDESKSILDVYIGYPIDAEKYGSEPVIQVNRQFINPDQIGKHVKTFMDENDVPPSKIIVYLHVDQDVKMGIVTDLKQKLRLLGTRTINYKTLKESI